MDGALMEKNLDSDIQATSLRMPAHLHRSFRVVAASRGVSMQELIIGALSEWLKSQGEAKEGVNVK